jgi:hypothetical protein
MKGYLQTKTIFPPAVFRKPSLNLGLVVVIPACKEPFLILSLIALKKCKLPEADVEVIVVINDGEKAPESTKDINKESFRTALDWASKNSSPRLKFHVLYFNELPSKKAGVGLARKIGMDEACWRFEKAGNPNGIIACFDADSKCDTNYLRALERHFLEHKDIAAASIYFEHPIAGPDYDEKHYKAITAYELHLRYFIEAQRWTGFPFAFHTVGSSMAVHWMDYIKQGGMNTRQAGEDFYFLHKFIQIGSLKELNETKVIPSPRDSDRVPFGTGKAVGDILKNKMEYKTYHPDGFMQLKALFSKIDMLYTDEKVVMESLPESLQSFLASQDFIDKLEEIRNHTGSVESFKKRFFQWFNAFRLMKFLHHHRQEKPDIDVMRASIWLIDQYEDMLQGPSNPQEALIWLRKKQRSKNATVEL